MHMLIADDHVQITDILMKYAHEEGYDVDCVHDGLSALRAAEQTQYDVILLDVMMPHINGFDVCKKIRQHSSTPIIMISAKVEEIDRIIPTVFFKHYPTYAAGKTNVSELARVCGLSRPTEYKYLKMI